MCTYIYDKNDICNIILLDLHFRTRSSQKEKKIELVYKGQFKECLITRVIPLVHLFICAPRIILFYFTFIHKKSLMTGLRSIGCLAGWPTLICLWAHDIFILAEISERSKKVSILAIF